MCKKVNAFERDPKRFQTLKSRVTKAGANDVIDCVQGDFLEMVADVTEDQRLCYITCDPSCSGSGMNLHNDQA